MELKLTDEQTKQLTEFWKRVEKEAVYGSNQVAIKPHQSIRIKVGTKVNQVDLDGVKELLFIRKAFINNKLITLILKGQPYYVGLVPDITFFTIRTSAFVFDLDKVKNITGIFSGKK